MRVKFVVLAESKCLFCIYFIPMRVLLLEKQWITGMCELSADRKVLLPYQ